MNNLYSTAGHQTEHSWTSLVRKCLDCGNFWLALEHFQAMQDNCAHLNKQIIHDLLKACTKLKRVERGQWIHTLIIKQGLDGDSFLGSSLLDMYAKCGSLAEAQGVFENLQFRDVVSWTALISGYSNHGFGQQALNCLRNMQFEGFSPNDITFVCSLKGCGAIGAIDRGKELHAQTVEEGYECDVFVGTTLVDMYVKCGLLAEAQDLFDELPVRNAVTWNALMTGYAECGLGKEVFVCVEKMHMDGVYPDAGTFVCSLSCCDTGGALMNGQKLHTMVVYNGFERDHLVGSALVDMYAKCRLLMEAQGTFDKLAAKDVLSWNALISLYSEEGLKEEVLDCVKQMQLEGVCPDVVTWVSILKACSSFGIEKGHETHTQILKGGFENDRFVNGSLVDMYAKSGALPEAQKVLDEAPRRNLGSWTSLIAGCAEHGFDEEALYFLDKLQAENVLLDKVALLCSLKACGTIGCMGKGQQIHGEIAKEGFEEDQCIGNTLVDMYAKCGSLEEAQEVFDELHAHDVVTWNALAAGYIQHGGFEEALNCLQEMRLKGISPSSATFLCSLKACGSIRAIGKGQETHAEVIREEFELDPFMASTVIDMYSKCGWLLEAQDIFDELIEQSVASWNALIGGYSDCGRAKEALCQLEKMQLAGFSPNIVTFVWILKACGGTELIDSGQEAHTNATQKGLELDPFLGSALVDMYAKSGKLAEAQKVFDKLPTRDVVSWTVLIAGYAMCNFGKEALNCLEQMTSEGCTPNLVTYLCSLKACSKIRAIAVGRALHSEVAKEGFERDVCVGTSTIDMYAKCGLLLEAREVLDDLQLHEAAIWTPLIAGYIDQGYGEEALNCLEEMQAKGLSPNVVTFVCILQACGNVGALNRGREFHSQIAEEGFERDPFIGSSLVGMYAKCGSLAEAKEVFDELSSRDAISWNALIAGYACQGECELVFEYFDGMRDAAIRPDEITLLSVLFACSHAGLVDIGLKYSGIMSREYGLTLNIEHYNCMVDMVSRAGQLNKAVAMLEKMPCQPDFITWSTILGACRKWGDAELGRHAFESMVQIGDNPPAAFSLMCNIYVDVDRLEDLKDIEMMQNMK